LVWLYIEILRLLSKIRSRWTRIVHDRRPPRL